MVSEGLQGGGAGSSANKWLPILLIGLVLVVFLSRLPFTAPAVGNDPDSERMIRTAYRISTTGEYHRSRFLGFPIPEYAFSLLWRLGPQALNMLTAAASAIAALFFALAARRMGMRRWLPATLAMAFVPVVFLNSVTPIDFAYALAFMMAALYFVVSGRPLVAGVMLGLATGCRASSCVMILPFALYMVGRDGFAKAKLPIVWMALSGGVVGAACYIPGFLKYGLGLIQYVELSEYPSLTRIIRRGLIEVWGLVGLAAVAVAVIALIFFRRKVEERPFAEAHSRPLIASAWIAAFILHLIIFLRLPFKGDYFIPAIPCLIILFWMYLPRRVFVAVCVILIISPFLVNLDNVYTVYDELERPYPNPAIEFHAVDRDLALGLWGPIIANHQNRLVTEGYLRAVMARVEQLPPETVVVAVYWEPTIAMLSGFEGHDRYVYTLTGEQFGKLRAEGRPVVFLRECNVENILLEGFDLEKAGAKRLYLDDSRRDPNWK